MANLYSLFDFASFSKELKDLEDKKFGGKVHNTSQNEEEMSSSSSSRNSRSS